MWSGALVLPLHVGLLGPNRRHYPVLPQVIGRDKDCSRVALPIIVLEVPYIVPYLDTWSDNHLEFVMLSQGIVDGIP